MSHKDLDKDPIYRALLEDPTASDHAIAKRTGSYRQKVWRMRKQLEDEGLVWGYTPVVDEEPLHRVLAMITMKMRPISNEFADIIIGRIKRKDPERQDVRLLNVLFVSGEYDWMIMFSAPDHASARRYYESLRLAYHEHLLEKPVIVDVSFPLVREGKMNPKMKELYGFIPV